MSLSDYNISVKTINYSKKQKMTLKSPPSCVIIKGIVKQNFQTNLKTQLFHIHENPAYTITSNVTPDI